MIATPLKPALNGRNYGGEKRLLTALSAIALYVDAARGLPTMREVAVARIYGSKQGRGSRNYASLWIRPVDCKSGLYSAGRGWAGGGGYHRPSAALRARVGILLARADPPDGRRADGAARPAGAHAARLAP